MTKTAGHALLRRFWFTLFCLALVSLRGTDAFYTIPSVGRPGSARSLHMMAQAPVQAPPRHIAFIPDGNGRWAEAKNLPRSAGHAAGAVRAVELVESCLEMGVSHVTLFMISTENILRRPASELATLWALIETELLRQESMLRANAVRVVVLGDQGMTPRSLRTTIERLGDTGGCTLDGREAPALTLCLALNYGGRAEIAAAARALAEAAATGELDAGAIDEAAFESALDTGRAGVPDPDLLVRTGGELRLSNFLLWQSAYAELVVAPELFPDFGAEQLQEAVREFSRRRRRFGGLPPHPL